MLNGKTVGRIRTPRDEPCREMRRGDVVQRKRRVEWRRVAVCLLSLFTAYLHTPVLAGERPAARKRIAIVDFAAPQRAPWLGGR